jgi:transcriptional regulator with XRE-family HTH domain
MTEKHSAMRRSPAAAVPVHLVSARDVRDYADVLRSERQVFAAKLRIARAVLGWSQTELGYRIGLTQRAVHKLEQGDTEPRRATVLAVDDALAEAGIAFAERGDALSITVRRTAMAPQQERPGPKRRGARRVAAVEGALRRGLA